MGNACRAFREAIDHVLHYILPRYTSYFTLVDNEIVDESHTSLEDSDSLVEKPVANGGDLSTGQIQNCDTTSQGTAGFLQEVISSFFSNYNFQIKVLNGNVSEKNLKKKIVHVEDTYQGGKSNRFCEQLNTTESVTDLGFGQLKWNVQQEVLIPGLEQIKINEVSSNSKCEGNAQRCPLIINDQYHESLSEELADGTGSFTSEHINVESQESRSRSRKYGMVPTDEILRQREQLVKNYSRSHSLVGQKNSNEDNFSSNRRVSEYNLRKLSLPHLSSGCNFLEDQNNENVKLGDYSLESPPLQVPVESYRKMSHPYLCSGGLIAFEELSKHLSSPEYYAEDPIFYNELLEDVQFPICSPMKVPPQQAAVRPTSCSGGGVVPNNSRRISLPDIYPERNPLLRPISRQNSTQSSSSFGRLVTTNEEDQQIFSDLMSQSQHADAILQIQTAEGEYLNLDREEVTRHV